MDRRVTRSTRDPPFLQTFERRIETRARVVTIEPIYLSERLTAYGLEGGGATRKATTPTCQPAFVTRITMIWKFAN